MKIVYLGKYVENEIMNGPEKFSRRLFQFASSDYKITFIDYFFKRCKQNNFVESWIGQKKVTSAPEVLRLGLFPLFYYLKKQKPNIIHVLTAERFTILVYLYKVFIRSKIVTTFHSIQKYEIPNNVKKKKEFNRYRDYIWEWLAIKLSDKLIFLSADHLALAEEYYNINKSKVAIIPNGVEKEFVNINRKIKIDNFLKIVFYNGNNDFIDRGLEKILNILNISGLPLKLYIIGRRPVFLDINLDVELCSPMNKNELESFLADKHILLKSTTFDTFPIFAIECMAAGLIVILSSKVGCVKYIINGKNGFVYDYDKPEKINEILKNLYYGKFNLNNISENAKKIINQLGWDRISKMYINCYEKEL
ncbi:MAG: glycosyltransferase family 4 protein [Ignavibacteriaceae bacterium]